MNRLKNILFLFLILIGLSGCLEDYTEPESYYLDLAIMNHDGNNYLITTDAGVKLKTESLPVEMEFDDNVRVNIRYKLLNPVDTSQGFSYWIYVDEIGEVLTKEIITIDDENRDSLGSAPVKFYDVWITQDFLTVYFSFYAGTETHYFNLTFDDKEQADNDTIQLTFRHDDNDDTARQFYNGYITFKLNTLRNPEKSEVVINFRGKEYDNVDYLQEGLVYTY